MAERPRPPRDWGDPDPEEILSSREPEPTERERFSRGLKQLGWLAVGVVVVAALGGYLLGRTSPQLAAQLLVRDVVVEEPIGTSTEGPAPTSGTNELGVTDTCGPVDEPLDVDTQRQAMYSGVVVVQARSLADLAEVRLWAETQDAPIITALNEDLDVRVMATAWARRMPLDGVNRELLSAFVTGHGRMGPATADC